MRNRMFFLCRFLTIVLALTGQGELYAQDIIPPADDTMRKIVISDVTISGNRRTKDYIIFRDMTLKKGDTLLLKDLVTETDRSRKNVFNTSLFNEVTVVPVKMNDTEYDVFVTVKERWYVWPLPQFQLIDRNFNDWWKNQNRDLSRTIYGIRFTHYNFSGRRDQLRAYIQGGYTQKVELSYVQPFADRKLHHGFIINAGYARKKEVFLNTRNNKQVYFKNRAYDEFINEAYRADIAYTYRRGIYDRHSIAVGYVKDSYSDSVIYFNRRFFGNNKSTQHYPELSYSYNYTKVDYVYYPLDGHYFNASFFKRGFTKDMNLNQFSVSGGKYFKLAPALKLYAGIQVAATIKAPFNQPFYNSRMFGFGEFYLRGQELYIVDGVAGALVRTTVRRQILNINIPVKFLKSKSIDKIPIKVFAKVYGDAGYAYLPRPNISNTLNNRLLRTWGFGIDIMTPVYDLGLRLEYSFNQLGQSDFYFK